MKFMVSMPFTGHLTLEVEAENERSAIEAFWEELDTIEDVATSDKVLDFTWEYTEHVTEGNVTHAELNDVEVERA